MISRFGIKLLLPVCLTLSFSADLSAQRHFRFFYGTVLDKSTRRPLANVNLYVRGKKTGTVTDQKGEYSFYLDSIPDILTVSRVGYITKKIILDSTSYKMTLYLSPEIKMLQEVVISAKPQEAVFKDQRYSVLDYEIDSGMVYLLVFRSLYSKSEIICRSPGGDTIARSGLLSFNAKSIDKDCLGNLHVFSPDSVYQLFRTFMEIRLIYPVTLQRYYQVLSGCVASTEDNLYFKMMTNFGLNTEFYTINKKTYVKRAIAQVTDEKKANMLIRNSEDAWFLMLFSQPEDNAAAVSETSANVLQAQAAMVDWLWVKKIIYPPVKSFLYKIGDVICIFNIPDLQMEFYDLDGNFSYKVRLKMDPDVKGRWTYEILVDPVTLKVFTPYINSGMIDLYEIDLNTGDLSRVLSVYHPFPKKLIAYENYLYYIYNDRDLQNNTMLFRQHM